MATEVKREETTVVSPPKSYDLHNVMYWETRSKSLVKQKEDGDTTAATLLTKSKDFLIKNCIEQTGEADGNKRWICKPIEGYNKTTYTIIMSRSGRFNCDCQGFKAKAAKEGVGFCSHCLAVQQFEFIKNEN